MLFRYANKQWSYTSSSMIRWPRARSLLDGQARRAEHGRVRVESSKKSELKDRQERKLREELCSSLNVRLTQ